MRHDAIERALLDKEGALLAEATREGWGAPIPLASEAKRLPAGLLPGALGEFVESLSAHTETPRELAALMCLAVTSASVAGRCEVEIHDDYTESLNLFLAVALESGNRKTAVVNAACKPLVDFEREEQERIAPQRRKALSERKTMEARIEKLRKEIANGSNDDAREELSALEESLIDVPEFPRFWAQDITPEALPELTSKNHERMAVLSDEGGYFDILAGRYSRGVPNIDFVLQSHVGTSVRVDRRSGDAIVLTKPLLTIGLSPQPAVLSGLAETPGFRGRGLLARFLYGMPPSNLGYRRHEPRPIPAGTRQDYADLIRRLLKLPDRTGDSGRPRATKLTFAPSAYDSWRDFQRRVEVEIRDGNRLAGCKDWAGKLPGAAARIAGIFHCVTTAPNSHSEIHRDTTEAALLLATILISHATCAFGLMGANVNVDMARRLVKWAIDQGERETTTRDIFCAFQSTLKEMKNLEPILKLLTEHNYVLVEDRPTGGRPSQICRWNTSTLWRRNMNALIDWRSYFHNVSGQSLYAKDAKGCPEATERVAFADLHTNFGCEELPSLEDVLRGRAVELWSDVLGERFWLVADEADVVKLGERRGTVYTAAEARRVIQIGDSGTVVEIQAWKRRFDGEVNAVEKDLPTMAASRDKHAKTKRRQVSCGK